ncbi:MAG TPA: hypothetical protein PKK06_11815 [Phycisphaerae bacterium]|nr:hypothetical protein [Phycisphaerae bacterium]HNU46021.1 hypothetical protein [Phycisphaerae bacterium]
MFRTTTALIGALLVLLTLVSGLLTTTVRADVVISLQPVDANGDPVTFPVVAGTEVSVEILVSVDGEHNPLRDVRLFQFDLRNTSEKITTKSFEWIFDPGLGRGSWFSVITLPSAGTAYTGLVSEPGLIMHLSDTPTPVAAFRMVVAGAGTLDAVNAGADNADLTARVQAGFDEFRDFWPGLGNLKGGTLAVTVASGESPGDDGQGGSGGGGSGDGGADPGDGGGSQPGDDGSGDDGGGADDGGADDDGADDGGAGDGGTDGGGADDGGADDGGADNGGADGGGSDDGGADDGGTDDGGATDGGADDGGADDGGATDDGATDGGATNGNDNLPVDGIDDETSDDKPGGRGFCGRGMIGPVFFSLCVLTAVRSGRRFGRLS